LADSGRGCLAASFSGNRNDLLNFQHLERRDPVIEEKAVNHLYAIDNFIFFD